MIVPIVPGLNQLCVWLTVHSLLSTHSETSRLTLLPPTAAFAVAATPPCLVSAFLPCVTPGLHCLLFFLPSLNFLCLSCIIFHAPASYRASTTAAARGTCCDGILLCLQFLGCTLLPRQRLRRQPRCSTSSRLCFWKANASSPTSIIPIKQSNAFSRTPTKANGIASVRTAKRAEAVDSRGSFQQRNGPNLLQREPA